MRTQLPLPQERRQSPPQFSAHVYYGQTAAWIKMPLGIEVGLVPGHTARLGPTFPPQKGGTAPSFGPCLLCPNGWKDQDATGYEGRPRPRPHCVTWGPSSPSQNGHSPAIFGTCLLWPNGRPPRLPLSTCFTRFNALYVF